MLSSENLKEMWKSIERDAGEYIDNVWRHYKGGNARVITLALDESTLEPVIVYSHGGAIFSRPLKEWSDIVRDAEGKSVPRYAKLDRLPRSQAKIVEPDTNVFVDIVGGLLDGCQVPIPASAPDDANFPFSGEIYTLQAGRLTYNEARTQTYRNAMSNKI